MHKQQRDQITIEVSGAFCVRLTDLLYETNGAKNMSEDMQNKMQTIMYALTKNAARISYFEFLEDLGISDEDYDEIKKIWEEKLGVKPYL